MLDLEADPTPGDPFAVRELAGRLLSFASDASAAEHSLRGLGGADAVATWVGDSGRAYRDAIGSLPGQLAKAATSYAMAGRALTAFATALDRAQAQADRALAAGREARARLSAVQGASSSASAVETRTAAVVDALRRPTANRGPAVPEPDSGEVAAAVRAHEAALARAAQLRAQVTAEQGEFDAARRLALAAAELRRTAEDAAVHALRAASHAGIRNKGWFGHVRDAIAGAWKTTVAVCRVAVVVLALVALVATGPVVAGLLLATSLVLLLDTLDRYARGDAPLWEVGLAALACLPFGALATRGTEAALRLTAATRALRTGTSVTRLGARFRRVEADGSELFARGYPAPGGFARSLQGGTSWISKDEELYRYGQRIKPIDGYYDVLLHGTPTWVLYSNVDNTVAHISHRQLARLIENRLDYRGGPIRLLSCTTGGSGATFAQNLANRMGVPVMAPEDYLWVDRWGNLGVGPEEPAPKYVKELTGTFRTFMPGGAP